MHINWRKFSQFKPLRLDWYILGEVVGPFIGGNIFFLFIFLMFQALRLTEQLIVHGVAGSLVAKLAFFMALGFVPTTLPAAFLIAVLISFGRLSADSELVAMKASGIGILRMAMPVTFLASIVVVLSVLLNLHWVPWAERAFKVTFIKVTNTRVASTIKEGTFTSGFFDLLIFADKVDTKTNQLKHVFIYDEREPKNPLTVVAQTGEIVPVKATTDLGAAALLKLYNGSIHRNDIESDTYQKIDFGEYRLFLKIDEGADTATIKPHMIPYRDLLQQIQADGPDTYLGRELRGEFWRRYAVALTPLLFVFLGIGFGTIRTRSVRAGASLTALVVLITYWALQTFGTVALQRGILSPFTAMQMPNAITLIAAVYAFRRAAW